ncbi:MAG: hypothetical protein JKY00_11255 [Roseicyclus sp.]|nr:hypothetical protein [Roseicyclus sp.]
MADFPLPEVPLPEVPHIRALPWREVAVAFGTLFLLVAVVGSGLMAEALSSG